MTTDKDSTTEQLRAGDADREHTAEALRTAATGGYLTMAEADQRLATAYAARYRDELDPLTADLPGAVAGLRRDWTRPAPAGEPTAEIKARAQRGLVRHGVVVAAVAALLVTVWAFSPAPFFFPGPLIAIMALTVLFHVRRLAWAGLIGRGGAAAGPWGAWR